MNKLREPSTTEQVYMHTIIEEQRETNRLLRQLLGNKENNVAEEIKTIDYKEMKRTELLKLARPIENKPKGWQLGNNDKLIELIKRGETND